MFKDCFRKLGVLI